MAYFILAVAILCAGQAIIRAVLLRRRGGDATWVVMLVGLTICALSVSLNLSPLRDLLPAHPRVEVEVALAVVGAVVVMGAPFVPLVPLAVRALRARRTGPRD